MTDLIKLLYRGARLILIIAVLAAPITAAAITPKEEEALSREFMKVAETHFEFIKDPLLVDYVNQVGNRILSAMPPQPFNYRFYIIKEDAYNAFAIPAGHIFINSGLMAAMETEDELAGILGHEIAHVTARHISDRIKRSKKLSMVALAGMVAGAFLGVGGSTEAAQAVTSGAMAASQSLSLAYSREDERQADQLGLHYLGKAGYSGRGLLDIMQKIRSKQWHDTNRFPGYLSTHPGSEERMANIDTWLAQNPDDPASSPVKRTFGFARAHARLVAQHGDEMLALQRFKQAVERAPEDPVARYGYALALARKGDAAGAIPQLRKALEKRAFDPYFLNDMGRIYFLSGQYQDAMNSLRGALGVEPDNPEALFLLSRTQMEAGLLREAAKTLEGLMTLRPGYPKASFFLGKTYGGLGRMDQAHYFLGLFYHENADRKNAVFHLERALSLLADDSRKTQVRKLLREIRKEKGKKAEKS